MRTLFFTLFLICYAVTSHASTYYISNSGNNEWNGSQATPWETLQHTVGLLHAGDSVIVLAGEYAGFCYGWDDEEDGTAQNPIVYKANPGATIISDNIHTDDGINLEGANYVIVDGFTITNEGGSITRAGIRSVVNTGVIIRNNTVDGMGTWGIFTGFSYNILIENNKCSNSHDEHGIYFSNSADNPVIRGNTCYSNNGCGIHMNGDIKEGGDGIISNALVEGNIIYDNGNSGGSAINCDGVQNSVIRNNLIYNNQASGISLYQIDGGEPAYNNKIINNTICMPVDGRWAINIGDGSTGNVVLNNILFNEDDFCGGIVIDAVSLSNFTSNYNVVVGRLSPDGDATVLNLEDWQDETGQDENSYTSTPADIFISTNDFHLKPGCIAINNGTDLYAPSVDIEYRVRPWDGGYDIGAYEFGAPVEMQQMSEDDHVIIWPNPFRDHLAIKSTELITRVEIYTLNGSIILSRDVDSLYEINIPFSNLKEGVYVICVYSNRGLVTKKIVN